MAYTYKGTHITGTSTAAKVFKKSGVKNAKVGQTYLNTKKGHVYKCTVKGKPADAKWKYDHTAIIAKPTVKVSGLTTPKRSGTSYSASWKVPTELTSAKSGKRATDIGVNWTLGLPGADPKRTLTYSNERTTSSSIDIGNVTIQGVHYSRASFYPFDGKPNLAYISCSVFGSNAKGGGASVGSTYTFYTPRAPVISEPQINANTGIVSVTVTTDAGTDANERYDTRYIVTVENTRTGQTWQHLNASNTATSFTLEYDPTDYQQLAYDEYIRVTFEAWARGFAGDSAHVSQSYTVAFPAQTTITSKTAVRSLAGKANFIVNTNSTDDHPVDQVRLEYLANTEYMSAEDIPGDVQWTQTDIVDNADCDALTMSVTNLIPAAGRRTWVRVKSYHGIENVLFRYSEPVYMDELETVEATATDDDVVILSHASGDDGKSAVVHLGWNADGQDDSDGTQLTWSTDPDAWKSTDEPEEYKFEWSDGATTSGGVTYHDSATITIKGVAEGVPVFIRARRYLDGAKTTYGNYSDIVAVTPNVAPSGVVLDVPTYVAEGSSIPFAWTYGGGGTQRAWQLLTDSGTVIASGENAMGSYNLSAERASELATGGVLSTRVEVATGSDFVASETMNIQIVEAPTLAITVPATITAQASNGFTVTSNRECSLIAVVQAVGSTGNAPVGIRYQPEGETVWSGVLNPAWTLANDVYTASVSLPTGLDLIDKASYTVNVTAVDESTGLKSHEASGTFAAAWTHQAIAPGDYVTITPNDFVDDEGIHHKTATIAWDIPSVIVDPDTQEQTPGVSASDVVDVYRLTGDGATLIGTNYPTTYTVTDEYAPFGDDLTHEYRIAVRTADGDVEYSDVEYDMDGAMMRFDWPSGVLELPYDITLSDTYAKDKATRKHLDGTTSVYYNEGVTRTGKQTTRLVRLNSQADIDTIRALARYAGNVFVRLPDGCAYEACVEVTDISTEGIIGTFSLSTAEAATTAAYMLPIPVTESAVEP